MTTTSDFEPGTVAIATVDGIPNVKVVRVEGSLVDAPYWITVERLPGHGSWHHESDVTDVRPLVVLDPEDYEGVRGVVQNAGYLEPGAFVRPLTEALQKGLRALVTPPRIPEPGLWGVVAVNGRNYVRTTEHGWRSGLYLNKWDDIADGAVLVREGIDD